MPISRYSYSSPTNPGLPEVWADYYTALGLQEPLGTIIENGEEVRDHKTLDRAFQKVWLVIHEQEDEDSHSKRSLAMESFHFLYYASDAVKSEYDRIWLAKRAEGAQPVPAPVGSPGGSVRAAPVLALTDSSSMFSSPLSDPF